LLWRSGEDRSRRASAYFSNGFPPASVVLGIAAAGALISALLFWMRPVRKRPRRRTT
jgi:hypothetical protein